MMFLSLNSQSLHFKLKKNPDLREISNLPNSIFFIDFDILAFYLISSLFILLYPNRDTVDSFLLKKLFLYLEYLSCPKKKKN
jgi:hypothetical protein